MDSDQSSRRAARVEAPADLDELYRYVCERGWGDGLPVMPPTGERVAAMLSGTRRAAGEVVAVIPPGFGEATVERLAINAVMAGCTPDLMPILIAAVEAVAAPPFNPQAIQATTNPATTWIIVCGPVARKVGINGGFNCRGPGTRANATLGRAPRLTLQNVGGALSGDMHRATHGQPGKYTMCCAENEDENPWEPLHVERGLPREASAVTLVGASGTLNMNDLIGIIVAGAPGTHSAYVPSFGVTRSVTREIPAHWFNT